MIPWEDVINRAGPPATLEQKHVLTAAPFSRFDRLACLHDCRLFRRSKISAHCLRAWQWRHGSALDDAVLALREQWLSGRSSLRRRYPAPSARADDNAVEPNRSSTTDAAQAVAGQVDEALKKTGAEKVVLVANSRGCQTARNYVKNFGGAAKVERMVLGGCVHHGVFVIPGAAQGSEFNGAGPSSRTFPPSRKCRRAFRSRSSAPTSSTSIRSRKANMSAWPASRPVQTMNPRS